MTRTKTAIILVVIVLVLSALACGESPSGIKPTAPPCDGDVLTGQGDTVIGVAHLTGCKQATLAHDGKSNFIVIAYDSGDNRRQSLVNEIGQYSGTVKWDKQAASLEVKADGNWTITVN